jgi:hypothetical protein
MFSSFKIFLMGQPNGELSSKWGNSQANGGTVKWTLKIKTASLHFSLKNLDIFILRHFPDFNVSNFEKIQKTFD